MNALSTAELAEWVASEVPRLGAHQFSLAPLDELVRHELLYALQRRDKMPPPLDPVSVRILISRLVGCTSMREADPEVICESGGTQYNSAIRGLFCDLARHLERAWVAYSGPIPTSVTSGRWRCWTSSPTARGAGPLLRAPSTSGSSSWSGCAR